MPLIHALREQGMRDRHWEQISKALNQNVKPTIDFTLSSAIDMGLLHHIEQIQEVSELATKEFSIEMALKKMQEDWIPLEMQVFL
jgi:dynein heavy chain